MAPTRLSTSAVINGVVYSNAEIVNLKYIIEDVKPRVVHYIIPKSIRNRCLYILYLNLPGGARLGVFPTDVQQATEPSALSNFDWRLDH